MSSRKPRFDKYAHYIEAVQSVEHDAWLYRDLFRQIRREEPRSLREDFCGTHALACEWVKRHPENTALARDLDPEPLEYGRTHAEASLTSEQHQRLLVLQQNVLEATQPMDLIVAGNFSFCLFRKRSELLQYFRAARKSMNPKKGVFILDMAGGSSMTDEGEERRLIRSPTLGRYHTIWDCKRYDPVKNEADFAIHFELKGGKRKKNVFTYHWRLWNVPEVRDLLEEAGFSKTAVFWDKAKSPDNETYRLSEDGENHEAWIAYIAGIV